MECINLTKTVIGVTKATLKEKCPDHRVALKMHRLLCYRVISLSLGMATRERLPQSCYDETNSSLVETGEERTGCTSA